MHISSVTIENFKRVKQVEFSLADVTILIGGNNSGKSSVLQGIHFAVTTLQSARSASLSPNKPINTLGFEQLIFKPASDPMKLHHASDMNTTKGPVFTFDYSTDTAPEDPKKFRLTMRRGKNANLSLTFQHNNYFYGLASDRGRPLSVFVPGLAGVALREERRTDAIVATGLAQGDANLYLRNILLRLLDDPIRLKQFHSIIGELFEGLTIQSNYDERLHQHIEILVKVGDQLTPLELVGTGTLQALQLVAYATAYDPVLLLLDEPDAHLHPSNQRLLAATLLKIAEQGITKIILATHSRHIFDALTKSDLTKVVWLRNGVRQETTDNDDLSILLDLGALDSFELHAGEKCRVVVLTEDSKSQKLDKLLWANGFPPGGYFIQPFNGVQNINMCSAIAEFFVKQGNNTHVLIHRDSDCMLPDEMKWFVEMEQKKLPERTALFLTPLTDVEHQFCSQSTFP
jgi:predicted ATPase